MMDQYKNQYKEETSQIHAPADLLERTRQAVAEEEKRLQAENAMDGQDRTGRENQQEPTAEMPDTDAGWQSTERVKDNYRNYNRVFRWVFSAAAAAILLLAVHRTAMLRGDGAGKSSTGSASDVAAAGGCEADGSMDGYGEGAAGELEEEKAVDAAGAESGEESDGAEYAAAEVEDYTKLQKVPAETDYAKVQESPSKTENSTSVSGEAAKDTGGERSGGGNQIEEMEKKYSQEDSAAQISITEVDKKPDFCDWPDTERVIRQEINFYVTESAVAEETADKTEPDLDGWSAYAEYNGTKYIITGQANDRDEFLEKAYETLIESVEGL